MRKRIFLFLLSIRFSFVFYYSTKTEKWVCTHVTVLVQKLK